MSAPDGPGTVSLLLTERGSKGATSYKHFAPLEQDIGLKESWLSQSYL